VIEINDKYMSLAIDERIIVTARFSQHAAADGRGAWIISCLPNRLLARDQAITALAVAELPAGAFCYVSGRGIGPYGRPERRGRRPAEVHDHYGGGRLVSRPIRHATLMIIDAVDHVYARRACPQSKTLRPPAAGPV
jgi:hypothetical protein